jgi:hypothetical protein
MVGFSFVYNRTFWLLPDGNRQAQGGSGSQRKSGHDSDNAETRRKRLRCMLR